MIKCFKVVSGEEIIGECRNEFEESYEIQFPALVTLIMPQRAGESVRIGILPICIQAENSTIQVMREKIVYSYTPQDRFVEQYREIVNPKPMIMPPSGLISPTGERISSAAIKPTPNIPTIPDIPVMMIDNPNPEVDLTYFDEEGE